ncbi:transposase [Salinibacter ruber]|uniref:transposase n=1 Tax=Salinibacter ruber TaxID=146919 RepID=UPI002166F2F1|nr:transposase [Salinibacter ruber]MCS3698407.1 hypothetical protein [Salinibacter ruber]
MSDSKIEALEEEIQKQIEDNQQLRDRCQLLETIPGVGLQTAAIVISELGSADRFHSARQAVAYAGLVPSHRESGTSVRGAPRMSKVGNGRLRRAMYFPAMSALRFNPAVKALGDRLEERGKESMVIIRAAMRKLLHICYGVLKTGRTFDLSLHPTPQLRPRKRLTFTTASPREHLNNALSICESEPRIAAASQPSSVGQLVQIFEHTSHGVSSCSYYRTVIHNPYPRFLNGCSSIKTQSMPSCMVEMDSPSFILRTKLFGQDRFSYFIQQSL